jgi:hypothetical protein
MDLTKIDEIINGNPMLSNVSIRVDKETQQASAIDIIRMVTGFSASDASNYLKRLSSDLKEKRLHRVLACYFV